MPGHHRAQHAKDGPSAGAGNQCVNAFLSPLRHATDPDRPVQPQCRRPALWEPMEAAGLCTAHIQMKDCADQTPAAEPVFLKVLHSLWFGWLSSIIFIHSRFWSKTSLPIARVTIFSTLFYIHCCESWNFTIVFT